MAQAITYTITKRSGEVVTFETALTIDAAAPIVESLPPTDFTCSLVRAHRSGRLSHAQSLWLLKLAHDATAPAAQGPYAPLVSRVTELQSRAKGRVALRLRGVTLKAVSKGPNTGACYLYEPGAGGEYWGKITPAGVLSVRNEIRSQILPTLDSAVADPVGAARAYGHETGSCSCCGRTLEDPVSVFGGIGPICLERLAGPEARKALAAEFKMSRV